jgi:hypothetical protein
LSAALLNVLKKTAPGFSRQGLIEKPMPGFPPERAIHTYFEKHDKRHTITVKNQSKSLAGFFKVINEKPSTFNRTGK